MHSSIINKPEYYFQPINIIRKFLRRNADSFTDISGIALSTSQGDYMQRALQRTGVYDLALTEIIWQLSQTGGFHVDVGANVGYVSRIMQLKAGPSGQTVSFEPNPEVIPILTTNRDRTPFHKNWTIFPLALGAQIGNLWLKQPDAYANNQGTAHITQTQELNTVSVAITTLDSHFLHDRIDLLKIDVEGFEWNVLQGAKKLLGSGRIANIVFEDFDCSPGRISVYLQSLGYNIYAIRKGWRRVQFFEPEKAPPLTRWEEPNYLATKMPKAELEKKFGKGYSCFSEIKAVARLH